MNSHLKVIRRSRYVFPSNTSTSKQYRYWWVVYQSFGLGSDKAEKIITPTQLPHQPDHVLGLNGRYWPAVIW